MGEPGVEGELDELAPGTRFAGRYRVTGELGRGGMGRVVAAVDETTARPVAVKAMLGRYLREPAARRRFLREGRLAGGLAAPTICRVEVVDVTPAGTPYIVMEHLRGEPLSRRLAREGTLDVGTSLRIARDVAAALAAAHAALVVHRDIKPSNVFVTVDDAIKVLDFGIAKSLDPDDGTMTLTATDEVVGTPVAIPPEVLLLAPFDERGDLYGLGVLLYTMLEGRPPIAVPAGDLGAILHEAPRPMGGHVPGVVASLVMRLLDKDPTRRPRSADATMALLDAAAEVLDDAQKRARAPRALADVVAPTRASTTVVEPIRDGGAAPRRAAAVVIVAATVALAAWLAWWVRRPAPAPSPAAPALAASSATASQASVSVELASEPPARVTLSGKDVGTTPLSLALPYGIDEREVVFSREGYRPERRVLIADRPREVRVTLKRAE